MSVQITLNYTNIWTLSSRETQLCTLKCHEQCHANVWHLFFSKTSRIIIRFSESFPYALQVSLEEMLVEAGESSPGPWVEVVVSGTR